MDFDKIKESKESNRQSGDMTGFVAPLMIYAYDGIYVDLQ